MTLPRHSLTAPRFPTGAFWWNAAAGAHAQYFTSTSSELFAGGQGYQWTHSLPFFPKWVDPEMLRIQLLEDAVLQVKQPVTLGGQFSEASIWWLPALPCPGWVLPPRCSVAVYSVIKCYTSSGSGSAFWGTQAKSLFEEEIAYVPKKLQTRRILAGGDAVGVLLGGMCRV